MDIFFDLFLFLPCTLLSFLGALISNRFGAKLPVKPLLKGLMRNKEFWALTCLTTMTLADTFTARLVMDLTIVALIFNDKRQ